MLSLPNIDIKNLINSLITLDTYISDQHDPCHIIFNIIKKRNQFFASIVHEEYYITVSLISRICK